MSKRTSVLKGSDRPLTHLGYKGGYGVIENLSTYREDPVFSRYGKDVVEGTSLAFDIERRVAWDEDYDLLPFTYSTMIDGHYPTRRYRYFPQKAPSKEEFLERASGLGGFVIDERLNENTGIPTYNNFDRNIFINWSNYYPSVMIGVIQIEPVPELSIVTDDIVPYAVDIHNQLNPARQLAQDVVNRSIEVAFNSDRFVPICSIK